MLTILASRFIKSIDIIIELRLEKRLKDLGKIYFLDISTKQISNIGRAVKRYSTYSLLQILAYIGKGQNQKSVFVSLIDYLFFTQ